MQNYLKTTCFLLSFLCFHILVAQTKNEDILPLISSKELKEDFQLLKTGLEKTHAGLYTYTSKDSLDKILKSIEIALQQPMTSISFYRKITPLLKLIGNGHTNFKVPPDYNKAINTTLPRFPFAIHWYQDTLYILRNVSDNETLEAGMIIKSINGESATAVMQTLADNLTRDAQNDSWPKGKVAKDFSGIYACFKGTPATFKLEIADKKGETRFLTVKGLTTDKIIQHAKKRYPNWRKSLGKPLQFEIVDSIGKLTIRSFYLPAIRKAKQAYKAFFKSTFAQIKNQKIKHLIIDIRDNGGGWPQVVNELFSYLIKEPYIHKTTAYTITNKLPNQKHYEDGFWHFLDMQKSLKLKKDGTIYKVTGGKKHEVVQPAQHPFQGKVYVLANPFTFSAATDFMGMLKNVNRATFVGEIAGGNPHYTTAWIMPTLILPNTKIKAILPVVGMETANNFPNDKEGIKPDFFVKNNIAAELQSEDAAMQFMLHRIQHE